MRLVRGKHGYIFRGISGWSVCWATGPSANDREWLFGIATWQDALEILRNFW